jgi:hypothetical protein
VEFTVSEAMRPRLLEGEAGVILQKFGEMVAEERRGRNFGLFETRDSARQWLSRD